MAVRNVPRPAPPPAATRRRGVRVLLSLALLAAAAAGGWYALRAWDRSAERSAALEQAKARPPAEALPALRRYLDRHPDDAEVLAAVVALRMHSGALLADVEPDLDRLCALRPDDPEPLRLRADLRRRVGRREEALADAERVLELAPDDHATRRLAAGLAADLGRVEVAERELTALLASSDYPKAELGTVLARVYWQAGDLPRAEQTLDRYAPPSADFAPAQALRGAVLYDAGRYAEAAEALRDADRWGEAERRFGLHYLAQSLYRLGRPDEARRAADRLDALVRAGRSADDARQRPEDMPTQVKAARALLAADRPADAAGLLEQATARLGPDADALAVLAECYDKLGRPADASATRRRAAPKR